MHYLQHLQPVAAEIHQHLNSKIKIIENSHACKQYVIFGFFSARRKELSICTDTIMRYDNSSYLINETFLHEAVHAAQACKTGFRYLTPFGMPRATLQLSAAKEADLRKVIAFDRNLKLTDREAFYMETRPELVRYVVRKYCL